MDGPKPGPPKSTLTLGMKLILILGPIALVGLGWLSIKVNEFWAKGMEGFGHKMVRKMERLSAAPSEKDRAEAAGELARVTKVLESNPSDTEALRARAAARYTLGQSAAAAEDYGRIVDLAPEDVHARHQRGVILEELGEDDKARKEFTILAALNSPSPEIRFYRASALEYLGRPRESLAAFRALLGDAPADWPAAWRQATQARIRRLEAMR